MPNERNEKYLAFNFERIRYWLGEGAAVSRPVAEILGKSRLVRDDIVENIFYFIFC